LNEKLQNLRAHSMSRLDPADWAELKDVIERLQMMQLAEHGLAVGDVLPDFKLPDAAGRLIANGELLDREPLVLTFFRGGWCPYCDLALRGLEAVRPRLEEAGATLVGVTPCKPEELGRIAEEKGLGFLLLSDTHGDLARLCGILYEMTPGQIDYYARCHGLNLPALHASLGWALPLPATYVAGQDGVITYAFASADWACRAEPDNLVDAVRRLVQAAEPATSERRGLSASSTKARTGGE
jgi:peroxiredoxin